LKIEAEFDKRGILVAKRICFISTPEAKPIYKEVEVEFTFFNGFSVSQKQKSIRSMHSSIGNTYPNLRVLEVSSKSTNSLGVKLSAFNLKLFDEESGNEYALENIFQSSKVFEQGGPYKDLLITSPKDAKRDSRLKSSGNLINFNYNRTIWLLNPKSMFYDWIYIKALHCNEYLSKKILEFDAFTDIEFNQEKSINCQARAAAIFVSLVKLNNLEVVLNNKDEFEKIYSEDCSI